MSIPRVASLLGNPVETASFSDWQALVSGATPEAFDLDFKKDHYSPRNPNSERNFATDVAAFANTQGGVIAIGIDEENRLATSITQVSFDEGLEQQMERWVANNVFPRPVWQSQRVPNPADSTKGVLLCIVPRSRLAPHAVHTDTSPTLRYPIRRNADNFFLAEHEIAERYRQRFTRGRESEDRLTTVLREGSEGRREPRNGPAVELSLVPLEPGEVRLSLSLQNERRSILNQLRPLHCCSGAEVVTGFRKLRYRGRQPPSSFYAELHSDGAGYGMAAVGGKEVGDSYHLFPGHLLCVTKELLDQMLSHSTQAGCVGDALLLARITTPGSLHSRIRLPRPNGISPWENLSPPEGDLTSRQTIPLFQRETDVMLSINAILTDWYQYFSIPEIDLIDSNGQIEAGRWNTIMHHPDITIHDRGTFSRGVFRF